MAEHVKKLQVQDDIVSNLGRLCDGHFFEDVEDELASVLQAIRATGKKGSVTVKMEITPKGEQLIFKTKIEGKAPRADDLGNIFFMTDDGHLSTAHPNQLDAFQS